jgi:hypothetical protein
MYSWILYESHNKLSLFSWTSLLGCGPSPLNEIRIPRSLPTTVHRTYYMYVTWVTNSLTNTQAIEHYLGRGWRQCSKLNYRPLDWYVLRIPPLSSYWKGITFCQVSFFILLLTRFVIKRNSNQFAINARSHWPQQQCSVAIVQWRSQRCFMQQNLLPHPVYMLRLGSRQQKVVCRQLKSVFYEGYERIILCI